MQITMLINVNEADLKKWISYCSKGTKFTGLSKLRLITVKLYPKLKRFVHYLKITNCFEKWYKLPDPNCLRN